MKTRLYHSTIIALLLSVTISFLTCAKPKERLFFNYIQESKIKGDLNFLASRELKGRETGKPGGEVAGAFLAGQMLGMNLAPLTRSDSSDVLEKYYQHFQIVGASPEAISFTLRVRKGRKIFPAKSGKNAFYFFNSPGDLQFRGDAVFAGYAIRAPEYRYDDLSGLDCRDKIVVAFYGEPLENDTSMFFNGKHRTHYMMPGWKAEAVAALGAKALIMIPTPENEAGYQRFLQRKLRGKGGKQFILKDETAVPVIYLSADYAGKLFGQVWKEDFASAQKELRAWLSGKRETTYQWKPVIQAGGEWRLSLQVKNREIRECRNVIGVLPGSNPTLRNEYILIGSHYDHEGVINGKIYRGADDNASGDVANLNVARAFSHLQQEEKPGRSILFAFWDAEEKGTLGSKYFVHHPLVELNKIKTAINMDMIGRDASFRFAALGKPMKDEDAENKVMIFYSAQAPELAVFAKKANENKMLHLLYDPNVFFTSGSDHVNFHERKIPVVYYFTGFHTDYTSPRDTPNKIDYNKLTRITRHIANFAYHLASARDVPHFNLNILTAPEGDFTR